MGTTTDVIVFFVGLTLWSQQIPNDCGLKAILPLVNHSSSPDTGTTGQTGARRHIPKHKAALVFRKDSYVSQVGWGEPGTLPRRNPADADEPELQFVQLDGDSVRFLTNGAINCSADLTGVKLARLREQLCPAKATLGDDYQAPYRGAAAVVAVPEGALQACLSVPAESQGRLDTRLRLQTNLGSDTNNTFVISASTMKETKELRLQPRQVDLPIELMVANLPESFFEEPSLEGPVTVPDRDEAPHMDVYLAMGKPGNAGCALSLQQWWDQLDPEGIPLCHAPTSGGASQVPDAMVRVSTSGANFECSNTQWP